MSRLSLFRRGFTLIEAAIVLGIVSLVLGGIWAGAAMVKNKLDEKIFFEDLVYMIAQTRSKLSGSINCVTDGYIDYNTAKSMGLHPLSWSNAPSDTDAGLKQWGGAPQIAIDCGDGSSGITHSTPFIRFTWWPDNAITFFSRANCRKLVNYMQSHMKPEEIVFLEDCDSPYAYSATHMGPTLQIGISFLRSK